MNSDITKRTLKLYWQHARRYPRLVVGIAVSTPLTILTGSFLPPLIMAHVIARIGAHAFTPHHIWNDFGIDLIAYAGLQIASGIIGWRIVDILTWRLEGNVERDIAQRVFEHLLEQSPNFHANRFGGSLVSQTNKLMGSYIRFADTTVFNVIPLVSALVFAGAILAKNAPLYATILIIFAIFYMISAIFVTRAVRHEGAKQAAAESLQTGNLADAITNVMAIKSFAGSKYEQIRFAEATDNTFRHLLRLMRAHNRQQVYFGALSNGLMTVSLLMAIISAVYWNVDLTTIFLIVTYTSTIASNLFQFSNNALRNYNRSLGDAADMVNILHLKPEIKDMNNTEPPKIHDGEIILSDVTFTYNGADKPLFQGLNLTIQAGRKIGLVGHSGSGKTTFTRLLLRFNDLDSGSISIDNQNICKLSQNDLRQHIAYVPQEPILFHRSLAENIGYGKFDASQKEIENAARLANAHDFISTLPEGYRTLVGERGVKLSGGQRQRIAIARALLKDAPILVLDEATSSLDSESESLIQTALWRLMEGRTTIVVAHRLSTIQKMDRIIVLEKGAITEQGTHNELLQKDGIYSKLWAHQSGGFIKE